MGLLNYYAKNKPIKKEYSISCSEQEFKEFLSNLMTDEVDSFFQKEPFVGYFYGEYGRRFSVKVIPKPLRPKTGIGRDIWIDGEIVSKGENEIQLTVNFHVTWFSRFAFFFISALFILLIVWMMIKGILTGDYKGSGIASSVLLLFYFLFTRIFLGAFQDAVVFFERQITPFVNND